jgi:hypothetical protein
MGYNPGRPPNINDLTLSLNGSWTWLGKIVTTGAAAVSNATTATPFLYQPKGAGDAATGVLANFEGTLAGRVLIVMPVSDSIWVAQGASLAAMASSPVTTGSGVNPGLKFGVGERPSFVMGSRSPFLQIVSDGGGVATLHVWELS